MWKKSTTPGQIGNLCINISLVVMAVFILVPLVFMFTASIMPATDIMKLPYPWISKTFRWQNYWFGLRGADGSFLYIRNIFNSLVVATTVSVTTVLLAAMAGYGLAKFKFKGRNAVFISMMATMMIPFEVIMIPLYMVTITMKSSVLVSAVFMAFFNVKVRMATAKYPDLRGEKLVVYIAFHEEEGRRLLDLFKEKTKVDYTYLRLPTGELLNRVINEAAAPQANIILGGPADAHQFLAKQGLIMRYAPPPAAVIPEKFKNPDRYWTGIYLGAIAIGINDNRWDKEFKPLGVEKPATFTDLLNPLFKGEIILPDPRTSGTGYTLLASLVQLWGEDEAFAYFKQLDQNVGEYTKSGFTTAQKTATGEYLIGVNFIHDQLLMRKYGFNLASIIPPGAGWEIGCVSMVKNNWGIRAAKAFMDFITGREAGQLHTNLTERISTRPDVRTPLGAWSWEESPINKDYDFYMAAEAKKRYLQIWEEKIVGTGRECSR